MFNQVYSHFLGGPKIGSVTLDPYKITKVSLSIGFPNLDSSIFRFGKKTTEIEPNDLGTYEWYGNYLHLET